MIDKFGGRKFINTQIVNIILGLIILILQDERAYAMSLFVINSGIYAVGNVFSPAPIHKITISPEDLPKNINNTTTTENNTDPIT